MLKKFNALLSLIACMILLHSCKPEEFNTDGFKIDAINPEYAIPLVDDDLALDDLIKGSNEFVKKYNDGSLSIVYQGVIKSSTAGESVNIPDQNFSQSFALTSGQASALTSGTPQTISFQSNKSFSMGNLEIDSIWLKAGALVGSINSQIRTGGNLKVTFEDAKNLGAILSLDIPFTYGGSVPVVASGNKSLVGYKWDMSKGGLGYNNVNIKFELTLNATTEPVSGGDQININLGFNGMKFYHFYGYVGQIPLLNGGDTIDLKIFDKASTTGQFVIEDPRVKIICGNSFGVPLKAGFSKLAGYTSGTGGFETNITGNIDPLPIPSPMMSQIGQIVYDSVTLDKNSSNIKTVINQKPKQVIFKMYIDLNPLGKQQRNFIKDNSQLKCTVNVELPLYGSARNFVFEKETPVDVKMPKEDVIERILIRFTANNGYPIDLATQIYLMDSTGAIFDSIFTDPAYKFMEAAAVGTDGKVTTSTKKTTDIVFDMMRSKRLSRLKKVKLRAEMGTTSDGGTYPSVKLYTHYILGIKLGIIGKLKIDAGTLLDSLDKKGDK